MALLSVTAALLLYYSDALKPAPQVTVFADNTYDETLRVVSDIDYEPFSYLDGNGEYAGLDVELIAEVANRLHMNLELTLLDWTDANETFLRGEADAILNMETDLMAGDDRLIVTIPTAEKQYVVYGRERVSSVAELYGRNVASLHDISELGLLDSVTYVDSYAEIFEGLKEGKYEFAICPIQVGNVFLERLGMTDVVPSYAVNHVYGAIVLSVSDAELQRQMDEVIRDLTVEGRMEELDRKWVTDRYQSMTLWQIAESHPWIIAVFLGGVFFIVFLLLNMNMLNRSMREKDAHSMELQEKIGVIEQQEKELVRSKEKAEQSSKAKTIFLSNMSHDIRTPMNAIIGYTNLALDGDKPGDEMRGYLEKIKGSSQHLLALINDVLEMSRIESGRVELEEVPADLKKISGGMRDMFETQMAEKNIAYTVDDEGIKNSAVYCDENRLNRVLLNLISNAYKFTPEGGTVSVVMTQETTLGECAEYSIRVKDSGIGMSEEFAEKVFEAFERERTSTVSGIQGTGLGMAITKSIVDMMGGSISLETAPGKGTEFTVRIRLALREDEPESEARGEAEAEEVVPNHAGARLLLVEDMDINRQIATMLLKNLGFEVETAENGREAVDKVAQSEPGYFSAVLMDIQMPVMNGYDAARGIRSLPDGELSQIPIVAMTANAFSEDIKMAREAGMDGHVAKPIDVGVLQKTLTEVLRGRS